MALMVVDRYGEDRKDILVFCDESMKFWSKMLAGTFFMLIFI